MKLLKIAALAATAVVFTGCASKKENNELASLQASVEEARAAALQASQVAQQALQISQQNAAKIDRVFSKSQMK